MSNTKQYVEIFHLIFLSHLEKRLDKKLYALKGGCNLRFFFKSIRYSEDMDLDIQKIAKGTLINKVDKIFENLSFQKNCISKGIEIIQISKPKQTDTTQRWKIGLKGEGIAIAFPTKIEFSRRQMGEETLFEAIEPTLIHSYGLYPIITNHFNLQAAFEQKIQALIHRTETQARDIFDLKLLIDQGAKPVFIAEETKGKIKIAIENALTINFSEFKSQVVAYLIEEYQSYYDSKSIWDKMQEDVIHELQKAEIS